MNEGNSKYIQNKLNEEILIIIITAPSPSLLLYDSYIPSLVKLSELIIK